MRTLLAILVAVLAVPACAAPPAVADVPDPLQRLIRDIPYPPLTSSDLRSILDSLNLEWPLTPDSVFSHQPVRRSDGSQVVFIVRSPVRAYCLLIGGRRFYEGGMGGPANFCLIDSTGTVLWKRENQDTLFARPIVSSSGMTALILNSPADRRPSRHSLVVEFISNRGVTGSARWTNLVVRPMQRQNLQEVYDFSPNGDFLITLNQSDRDTFEINSTFLYCVAPDGSIRWGRYLGTFDPNELAFSSNGDRIVLDNLRRAGETYVNQVRILDSAGNEMARHMPKRLRGAGSCLDSASGKLYFDDGGLVAIDVRTGKLERSVSPEPLRRIAETSPVGSWARNTANALLSRVSRSE